MARSKSPALAMVAAALLIICAHPYARQNSTGQQPPQPQQPQSGSGEQAFRFRTGVELINVTATVTDANGRFVSGLQKDDFRVYQDNELQTVTHFSNERVPVSLGILLDTSGSMAGEKMVAAREALNSFLQLLNDPEDEVFLYRFSQYPELVEGWTRDKRRVSNELGRIQVHGGTALYDAVAEAIPLAQSGHNRKKALVIISDGNDTGSHTDISSLKRLIRETEVLIYAVGIDTQTEWGFQPTRLGMSMQRRPRFPVPFPFPMPGGRNPPPSTPPSFPSPTPRGNRGMDDRVNVAALREITDDSGGRTEIVRSARDLNPATASIADELSRQYYLGYPATGVKDGKWHAIRVDMRNGNYHVRARRGFIATP
jgi:VWFA-related protein